MRHTFTASARMAEIAINDNNGMRIAVMVAHGSKPVVTLNNKPVAGFPPSDIGKALAALFERLEPELTRYVGERNQLRRFVLLANIRDKL